MAWMVQQRLLHVALAFMSAGVSGIGSSHVLSCSFLFWDGDGSVSSVAGISFGPMGLGCPCLAVPVSRGFLPSVSGVSLSSLAWSTLGQAVRV